LAVILAAAGTDPGVEPEDQVVLAGQAAKLYRDLQYDLLGVETVPVFEAPGGLFERGEAVIPGSEVPVDGGALRCFETIPDDTNAPLVQVHSGNLGPLKSAGCTTYDILFSNHPPQAVIDDLVVALNPFSIVIAPIVLTGLASTTKTRSFIWAPDY
jgi:putative mRNA 3-end processing factor